MDIVTHTFNNPTTIVEWVHVGYHVTQAWMKRRDRGAVAHHLTAAAVHACSAMGHAG